jgi:hypothetical protein
MLFSLVETRIGKRYGNACRMVWGFSVKTMEIGSLDEPVASGDGHRLTARAHAELGEEVGDMT